ncbi:biotin/lipoyl-binding protein [Cryobacterium sp. SO2]|uniref:efflux RND transporter periplasmic adaptor subunit n=1 Tax=Cryobacterium sp. SO2 TaxID=1897060 RepID=UPI00223E6109|nr:biotin/lipoyl-binding protein [Cryobacterium sp. SO2]WEO77730.1 biotin/lipoyl-binding protein [Cryobacterium sp. SO2]
MKLKTFLTRIRPRTWVIAGVVVVALAGGGVYWFVIAAPASSATAEVAPTTVAASLETMEQTVASSGTLAAAVQEDVSFSVSGTVTAVNVQAGTVVAAGDVLATVDTLTVDSALLTAKATLASAEAKLSDSEDASDGSDSDLAQIAANGASVTVAQTAVTDAEADVAAAVLTAPVAGLVTAATVEVGDVISGSGSSGSSGSAAGSTTGATTTTTASSAAFTIVGTDSWQIDLAVGETDIADVSVADQVELSLDDGTAFFGTVTEVGLLPSTTSGAVTYPVVVTVTGTPDGLFDGIAVTASIVYERRTDVLTVASSAVTTTGDTTTVTTLDDDGNEVETPVTVGETVGNLTEIVDGLEEGDEVVVTVFTPAGGTNDSGTDTGEFPSGGMPGGGTGEMPTDMQAPTGTGN